MHRFTFRKISNETLGEKLKSTREKKNITLEKVEEVTGIEMKYLNALEAGEYNKLPADVYVKNFLKVLAHFFHLEKELYLNLYLREKRVYDRMVRSLWETRTRKNKDSFRDSHFIPLYRFAEVFFVVLFILGCLGYLGIGVERLVTSPKLIIFSPTQNYVTQEKFIEVKGRTTKETKVIINDEIISPDKKGDFAKTIDLQQGMNTIEISAQEKHGPKKVEIRKVLVVGDQLSDRVD